MRILRTNWTRLTIAACLALLLSSLTFLYTDDIRELPARWRGSLPFSNPNPTKFVATPVEIFDRAYYLKPHAIDELIRKANEEHEQVLKKRTTNLKDAAAAYRARRGRHPPPGFDAWVKYALDKDCILIEDLFDQIYRDLEPFHGMPPTQIRDAGATMVVGISIRNGTLQKIASQDWHFVKAYFDMLEKIVEHLPDVDIPVNEMDESRILATAEEIAGLMQHAENSRDLSRRASVNTYPELDSLEDMKAKANVHTEWLNDGSYWQKVRACCPADSEATHLLEDADFSTPPIFPNTWPPGTESSQGFVSNWTTARDPCSHPHLRNQHGTFVEPITQSTSPKLVPMFGGSKLLQNNDILVPPAVYWNDDDRFAAASKTTAWKNKRDKVFWRGVASGGRNKENNWTRFQRHRLLSMLNGTQVEGALVHNNYRNTSNTEDLAATYVQNFPSPVSHLYPLYSQYKDLLPEWLHSFTDAAFVSLICFPDLEPGNYSCPYTGNYYRQGETIPLQEMFKAKYLPDVDGNSFSGRYRAFLMSGSLPFKATLYAEWHDDRLIPWKHFVPMDNTFRDLWSLLEYFVARDEKAKKIAVDGAEWSRSVLRKEDMLAYVWRLVLEYARVSSDEREIMGWMET